VTRILLFDIDGTLVLTGGAGVRAMSRAFEDVFAVPDAFRNIQMPGRTDTWILSGAAEAHGIANHTERLATFRDVYLAHLLKELELPGPRKGIMPGVVSLLQALEQREDVYLALLTGNYEEAARAKLSYFDLWRYFRCGAFGDDSPDRNSLVPSAIAKIRERGGPAVAPGEVVIIGDTPHDVACAKASGARSVAVATGGFSVEALRETGADAVLQDFSETREVLRAFQMAE
jgi:phosphoglycolate phosphatase-like HAD superfamily hydrolase